MPNPNELRLIRAALDLKQAPMAKALGINSQSYYSSLESDPDKPAAQEVLEKARALYLERMGHPWPGTMRDLVRDIGAAGLPAKEVPAGTIGGSSWSQSPEERHRAEAVRRALEEINRKGPTEAQEWAGQQAAENALRGRNLFERVTQEQRQFLADWIAGQLALGSSPEVLERGVRLVLDGFEAASEK